MEFVLEPVVSELFKGLFKILGSDEVRDFARQLVGGVDSDLEKLKKKLQMVENLLPNAEDKQLTDKSDKEWLDNLQHWAYDAEDLLDEFAYEASRRKLQAQHQASSSRGFSFLPAFFPSPSFNVQMGSKIKEINRRLEQLRQERSADRELQHFSGMSSSKAVVQRPEETSSVPPEQVVYGRKEDEATLLDRVKNSQPSEANFQVLAIVGMGGIGKTTIARVVYNHKELETFKFEKKAWVCVSDTFDVLKISKQLLEQFSSSVSINLNEVPNNLNGVQVKLKEAVSGKKFLLVLDDIWKVEYSEWEKLMSPFVAGAPGSTMIVTTRDEHVAKTIRCSYTSLLKLLSDEDCKSLFEEHAFGTGAAAFPNQISSSIYKTVVDRCGGLPLAAKTLGGLLHSKPSDTWEKILNSKIWSDESDRILPALKLSYYYLPSILKRCFAYCAIFPQDYEFNKKELAFLWMAEGIVQPSDNQLDVAGECFDKLCSRSLFQQSSNHSSTYGMHDLVHDLAQSIFKKIGFRSEQNIRHFSYTPDDYIEKNKFKVLEKVKSLRTFLSVFTRSSYGGYFLVSAAVVFDLLSKLKMLRVLSFESHFIIELPNSIGDMKHLRYLNLSYTRIKSLPESTSQLFNLQTLLLKDCSQLMKLPSNMRYLTNLCHLDISGKNSLKEMPLGMKELKNLHILSNFIVGKDTGSNLDDLKSLGFLQGELHISKLENVTDPNKIEGQILGNKNNLEVLLLEWEYDEVFDTSLKADVEMSILNKLKPPSNLKELTISGYGGESFPSWLGDSSLLFNLVVLKLEDCKRCTSLPSLDMLSSLEDLTIREMSNLKRIDFQSPFRSLEFLYFEYLLEWEHWDTGRENKDIEIFSKLRGLFIIGCPKLIEKLPDCIPSLERLVIRGCTKLVVSLSNYPRHCKLEIDGCEGMVCNNGSIDFNILNSLDLENIQEVEILLKEGFLKTENLRVEENEDIIDSWRNLANDKNSPCKGNYLSSLQRLSIFNCKIDVDIFGNVNFLSNLSFLEIDGCQNLACIKRDNLPLSLKKLEIRNCEKLEFLEDLNSCLLEDLVIEHCYSLTCISLDGLLPETLKDLSISDCKALKTLSSRNKCLPKALISIHILSCSELKSIGESFDNSTCLREITLGDCANLESLPLSLHHLTCLESISISSCPKLSVREGVPSSLIGLYLSGDVKLDKPMIEWELHNLKYLTIWECEDAASILQEDNGVRMLTSLKCLGIYSCLKLKHLSSLIFQSLISLESLTIADLLLLESIPHLTNLTSLTHLSFQRLPLLESIPDLTNLTSLTHLTFEHLPLLKSIPYLTNLASLEEFAIDDLPLLESIPHLTNLTSLTHLTFEHLPLLKSIPYLTNVTSLTDFRICQCPRLESIPDLSSLTSRTSLSIMECRKLKFIPALGSLQHLKIFKCPNLKSLQILPSSLLSFVIEECPLLKKQWTRGKGKYSSKIAHIPRVEIDGKFIYNLKEEE